MIGESKTVDQLEATLIHLLQQRDKHEPGSEGWYQIQHAITARLGRLERMKQND